MDTGRTLGSEPDWFPDVQWTADQAVRSPQPAQSRELTEGGPSTDSGRGSSEAKMPTYVCWTRAGQLSPDQRQRIAKSITEIHHDVALAPRYFVQVIFNEWERHSHYIGGAEPEDTYIWIRADIRSGRTQEQKRQLLTRIVDEVCAISDVSRENVRIYLSELPGTNIMEFGQIAPQPEEEDAWFAKLSDDLQERLRTRA